MKINKSGLIKSLPDLEMEITRLDYLINATDQTRIAVFGKFNHGKSTLLNALVGEEIFAASDKRETVVNKEFIDEKNQTIWLDTPGLDADVEGKDDFEANQGAMTTADVILLVHNAKAGELDKYETEHFNKLLKVTTENTKKILVITQIDQIEKENLKSAVKTIKKQFPQFDIFCVSATRYLKYKDAEPMDKSNDSGSLITSLKENIFSIFEGDTPVKQSGIPKLIKELQSVRKDILKLREKSKVELCATIEKAITTRLTEIEKIYPQYAQAYSNKKSQFISTFGNIFNSHNMRNN